MARKERKSVKTEKKDNVLGVNVIKGGKVVKGQSKNVQKKKPVSGKTKCHKCSKVVLNFHKNKLNLCGSCLKNEASSSQKTNKIASKVPNPSSSKVSAKAGETSRKSNRISDKNNSPKLAVPKRNNPAKPATPGRIKTKNLNNRSELLKKNELANISRGKEANPSKSNNKRKLEVKENKMSLRGKKRSYAQLASGISPKEENQVKKIKNTRTSKDTRESRSKKPTVKGSEWLNTIQSKKVISSKPMSSIKGTSQPQSKIKSPRLTTELTNKGKKNVKVSGANTAANKNVPASNVKRKSVGNVNQTSKKQNMRSKSLNNQIEVQKTVASRAKPHRKSIKVIPPTSKILTPPKNKIATKRNVKSREENKHKEMTTTTQQANKKDHLLKSIKKKFDSFTNKNRDSEPELKENVIIAREILQDILNSVVSSSKTSVKCDDMTEEEKDVSHTTPTDVMEVDTIQESHTVCEVDSTNLVSSQISENGEKSTSEKIQLPSNDQNEIVLNQTNSMDATEFDLTRLKSKIEINKSKSIISTAPDINKLRTTNICEEESQKSTIENTDRGINDKLDHSSFNVEQNKAADECLSNKTAPNKDSGKEVQIPEYISGDTQNVLQGSCEKTVLHHNTKTDVNEKYTNSEKQAMEDKEKPLMSHTTNSFEGDSVSVKDGADFNQESTESVMKTKICEDDKRNKLHTEENLLNRMSKIENGICITNEKEKNEGEEPQIDKSDVYLIHEDERNGESLDKTKTEENNSSNMSPKEDENASKDPSDDSKCKVTNLQKVTVTSIQGIDSETNDNSLYQGEKEGWKTTDSISKTTNSENIKDKNIIDGGHSQSTTRSAEDDSSLTNKMNSHTPTEKEETSIYNKISEGNEVEKKKPFCEEEISRNVAELEINAKSENNVYLSVIENSNKIIVHHNKSNEENMEFVDENVPSIAECKQSNNKQDIKLVEEIIISENLEDGVSGRSNIRPNAFEDNTLSESFNAELGIENQSLKTIDSKTKQEEKVADEDGKIIFKKNEEIQHQKKIAQHPKNVEIDEDNSDIPEKCLQSKEKKSIFNKSEIVLSNAAPVMINVNQSVIESNNKSEHEASPKISSFNGNNECENSDHIASKVVSSDDVGKVCASSKVVVQNVTIEEESLNQDRFSESENSPNNYSAVKDKENELNHVQCPKTDSQSVLCSTLAESSNINKKEILDESLLLCEHKDLSKNDEGCKNSQTSLESNPETTDNSIINTSAYENLVQSHTIISEETHDSSIQQFSSDIHEENEVDKEQILSQAELLPENFGVKIIENESLEKQISNLPTVMNYSKDKKTEDICSNTKLTNDNFIRTSINLPGNELSVNQKEDEAANDQASATCSDRNSRNKTSSSNEKVSACEEEKLLDDHSEQTQKSSTERINGSSKDEEVDAIGNLPLEAKHCENINFTLKPAVETSQTMDQGTPPATYPDIEGNHTDTNFSSCETSAKFSSKMDDVTEDCISVDDADGESMLCNSETRSSSNRMSIDDENAAMELDLEDTATDVNQCPTLDTKVSDEMTMEVS